MWSLCSGVCYRSSVLNIYFILESIFHQVSVYLSLFRHITFRSILRHKYTFACLVWTTLIKLTKKIANVITINRGNHLKQPESTFKTNWGYYRCKRWFLFWQDTDQYEVIKRTIFATFSHHKYFQTSIGISRGLHLTNKLLKVILTIWMLIFDDYMWRRRWLKVGEFSR